MTSSEAPGATGTGSAPRLVGDVVRSWAVETPDAEALSFEGTTWTWAQWDERVRRVSGAPRAAGLVPGDRVATVDKNHPTCLEPTLGASAVGVANAVVNRRLSADELAYVLGDSAPRLVLAGAEHLAAVEAVRDRVPSVERVAVVGVPDDQWGEAVKAVVVAAEGATVDGAALVAWARDRLAHYKCPRSVDVVEVLPRNATGKILKNQLRRPYWEGTGRRI